MRIIRHRSGPKKSIYGKYSCVVIDPSICLKAYLRLFRGYTIRVNDTSVLYKEIVSDRKFIERRTTGL